MNDPSAKSRMLSLDPPSVLDSVSNIIAHQKSHIVIGHGWPLGLAAHVDQTRFASSFRLTTFSLQGCSRQYRPTLICFAVRCCLFSPCCLAVWLLACLFAVALALFAAGFSVCERGVEANLESGREPSCMQSTPHSVYLRPR